MHVLKNNNNYSKNILYYIKFALSTCILQAFNYECISIEFSVTII